MPNIEKIREDIAEAYSDICESFGLNPVVGKIYDSLFFSDRALSLEEISKRTGYSKSTVCSCIKSAERFFDIERFKKPGSKKVYFVCQHNLSLILNRFVSERLRNLNRMHNVLSRAEKTLEQEGNGVAKQYLTNIRRLRKDYEHWSDIINSIERHV